MDNPGQHKDREEHLEMAFPNAIFVTGNTTIANENVYGYQFINLSNVPVLVNGVFLDRYYIGGAVTPTLLPGSFNIWVPPLNAGERDNSTYQVVFQDTYYNGVTPNHRLYVVKKQYYKRPHNQLDRNAGR